MLARCPTTEYKAQHVYKQVALAAVDFLTRVVPSGPPPFFRRLDRLVIQDWGRGLPTPTVHRATPQQEQIVKRFQGPIALPLHEVPIHDAPGRQVTEASARYSRSEASRSAH